MKILAIVFDKEKRLERKMIRYDNISRYEYLVIRHNNWHIMKTFTKIDENIDTTTQLYWCTENKLSSNLITHRL